MTKQNFPYWDTKFYYWIHINRQKALWNTPCTYSAFAWRLWKWMSLHDAIYKPRAEQKVRDRKRTPTIQDNIRRRQVLNEENVMILDFDEIEKAEKQIAEKLLQVKPKIMAKYNMKPKKTLLQKFISLFQKKWQKKES